MIPLYLINRIIGLVSLPLLEGKKSVGVEAVSDALKSIAIEAKGVNRTEIEQKSVELGLIRIKNDDYWLTSRGNNLLKLQVIEDDKLIIDALTEEQQKFFVELIFSSPNLKTDLQNIFSDFRIHHSKKIWFYDSKPDQNWDEELLNWLTSCNFWNVVDNKLEVKQLYSKHISKIKKRTSVTQQHLEEIIKIEKEVGEKAEQLTLSYEKERLNELDYPDMAMSIEQISKIDVAAGYDVESFNGKDSTLSPDRMIEVKGTSGSSPYFYWSENEIKTAKNLKEKYWVYLWIEVKSKTEGTLYKKIQNPYEKLFRKSKKKPKAVLFRVDL